MKNTYINWNDVACYEKIQESYHGQIDEFAVWNRSLNNFEVDMLYNSHEEGDQWTHVGLIVEQKKGFWNQIFRRKSITPYVNGVSKGTIDLRKGTTMWWAKGEIK